MELNELVSQIAAKVAEKISAMEQNVATEIPSGEELMQKQKLLILSECHGTDCCETWKSDNIGKEFDITYGLNNESTCDIQKFDVIALQDLSNMSLGKIAQGIADTTLTELIVKAILLGKKIIIPNEGVELFQYCETAPKIYLDMMMQKIELLKNSGIVFCNLDQIENLILCKECVAEKMCSIKTEDAQQKVVTPEASIQVIAISKRVITEFDVKNACEKHANQICVTERTIITDLAREYAEQRGISFTIG